jgi:hypothetical protein
MNRLKFALIVLFFIALGINKSFSQEIKADNINPENQKDQVIISYDINNPDENKVLVDLIMKKKTDKSFRYQPKYLSGDIGEGNFNGYGKKISWNKQKERLPMINMDDFYFEINVKVLSSAGNHKWLWIGTGAAVIGGGTALYFLLKKNNDESSSQSSNMPQPPGRP